MPLCHGCTGRTAVFSVLYVKSLLSAFLFILISHLVSDSFFKKRNKETRLLYLLKCHQRIYHISSSWFWYGSLETTLWSKLGCLFTIPILIVYKVYLVFLILTKHNTNTALPNPAQFYSVCVVQSTQIYFFFLFASTHQCTNIVDRSLIVDVLIITPLCSLGVLPHAQWYLPLLTRCPESYLLFVFKSARENWKFIISWLIWVSLPLMLFRYWKPRLTFANNFRYY